MTKVYRLLLTLLLFIHNGADAKEMQEIFEYSRTSNFVIGAAVKIGLNKREVTVLDREIGKEHHYVVSDEVVITIRGKKAKLKHLRVGDRLIFLHGPIQRKRAITRIKVPETDLPLAGREESDDEDE